MASDLIHSILRTYGKLIEKEKWIEDIYGEELQNQIPAIARTVVVPTGTCVRPASCTLYVGRLRMTALLSSSFLNHNYVIRFVEASCVLFYVFTKFEEYNVWRSLTRTTIFFSPFFSQSESNPGQYCFILL